MDGLTEYNGQNFNKDLIKAVRIYPHKHGMEGFFVIKLRKMELQVKNAIPGSIIWTSALDYNDPIMEKELISISGLWGIKEDYWRTYRFVLTKNRIWMLCGKIRQIPSEHIHNAGLLLAEKRITGWKLTNQSVQFLGKEIRLRRISLNIEELKELFSSGSVYFPGLEKDYYVLEHESKAIASVYCEKNILQIRLPHAFRLAL